MIDVYQTEEKGEWWLHPTAVRTDAAGRVSVRGFAGDYAVRRAGAEVAAAFAVERGTDAEASVTL